MASGDVTHYGDKKQQGPYIQSPGRSSNKGFKRQINRLMGDLLISSPQFHVLFDKLPQAFSIHRLIYDKTGAPTDFVIVDSNPAYSEIEPFRKNLYWYRINMVSMKTSKTPLNWISIFSNVVATGTPAIFNAYCLPYNKWFEIYVYSPKKSYFFCLFIDISPQQKTAEEAIAWTEKRFRKLYETTQDGIMARDLSGNMIDCNPAYVKMLGFTKKELHKLTIRQLLPEKWHEQREEIVKKVLETGRSALFEREYKRKDGSIFPASVRT